MFVNPEILPIVRYAIASSQTAHMRDAAQN
jgi:hypothetical protein